MLLKYKLFHWLSGYITLDIGISVLSGHFSSLIGNFLKYKRKLVALVLRLQLFLPVLFWHNKHATSVHSCWRGGRSNGQMSTCRRKHTKILPVKNFWKCGLYPRWRHYYHNWGSDGEKIVAQPWRKWIFRIWSWIDHGKSWVR